MMFILLFVFGLFKLTTLSTFDIQNEPDCTDPKSDFCAKRNGAYMGKYQSMVPFIPVVYFRDLIKSQIR